MTVAVFWLIAITLVITLVVRTVWRSFWLCNSNKAFFLLRLVYCLARLLAIFFVLILSVELGRLGAGISRKWNFQNVFHGNEKQRSQRSQVPSRRRYRGGRGCGVQLKSVACSLFVGYWNFILFNLLLLLGSLGRLSRTNEKYIEHFNLWFILCIFHSGHMGGSYAHTNTRGTPSPPFFECVQLMACLEQIHNKCFQLFGLVYDYRPVTV
jgi:hypothetical protein